MSEPTDNDEFRQALGAAISGVVSDVERGMTLKWVCLIESAAPDGKRGVWLMANPESKSWDLLGLLHYGIACEQGSITASYRDGD